MNTIWARSTAQLALALALLALGATQALAQSQRQSQRWVDPPSRVARLSHVEGSVSFSPAGTDDWRRAQRNRPHWRGDRFWSDRRSRAELELGGAALRLDERTAVEILQLDDRTVQVQVTEGTVNLAVRYARRGELYEIATPTLALVVDRRASLRVDVDPRSDVTEIVVRDGSATAYGERGRFALAAGDAVRFYDSTLRDYDFFRPRLDGFDQYADARDLRLRRSRSLQYVPEDLIGYAELDDYGSWRTHAEYGSVWFPSRVSAGWRPYRDGHWIHQEPWGWTWVDDAEWGFATSHYGRWAQIDRRWGWIPSPRRERPVYAPALVGFVGGFGTGSREPIGWFPLGPREVYTPSYRTSRDYFGRVNYGNTAFGNRGIVDQAWNAYDRGGGYNYDYRYDTRNEIVAVPRDVFINARPVGRAAVPYQSGPTAVQELDRIRQLMPVRQSRWGTAPVAAAMPDDDAFKREVLARSQPAQMPSFPAGAERSRAADTTENVQVIRGAEGLPVIPRDDPRTAEDAAAAADRIAREQAAAQRARDEQAAQAQREAESQRQRDADAQRQREVEQAQREAERVQREQEAAQRDAARRQFDEERRRNEEEQRRGEAERAAREAERAQREAERQAVLQQQQQEQQQREAEQQVQREREQQQRGQEAAQREAERAQREAEQAAREAQHEAERQQREQEAAQREAERQQREQEAAQREAERQQREQEAAQREAARQQQEAEAAQREAERQAREQAEAQNAAERAQREQEQAEREAEREQRERDRKEEREQRDRDRDDGKEREPEAA